MQSNVPTPKNLRAQSTHPGQTYLPVPKDITIRPLQTPSPNSLLEEKENLTITRPQSEKLPKRKDNFEPTPPNYKKRILDSDDSDDEIRNRNESEPERKKIRNAFFCDLVWPLTKMDQREYSRHFKLQMMEAMDMFNQGLVWLVA